MPTLSLSCDLATHSTADRPCFDVRPQLKNSDCTVECHGRLHYERTLRGHCQAAEAVKVEAREYDARMRLLMPRLFCAQAAASGLSDEAFSQIDPLVQRLVSLDTKIGNASVRLDAEPDEALLQLKAFVAPVYRLTQDVVLDVRLQLRLDRSGVLTDIDAVDGS